MLYDIEDVVVTGITEPTVGISIILTAHGLDKDYNEFLIQQSYAQFNGQATLYDLRTLLANWMEEHNVQLCKVLIQADSDTAVSFYVLYANINRGRSVDDYLTKYFLMSANSHVAIMSQNETVFFLSEDGSFSAQIIVSFDDVTEGLTRSFIEEIAVEQNTKGLQVGAYNLDFEGLLEKAKQYAEKAVLKTVVLKSGARFAHFFFERGPVHKKQFVFFNEFNALEQINIDGVTTEITDAERQVALCNHTRIPYNLVVNKSYRLESSALMNQQLPLIEGLFVSRMAFTVVEAKLLQIILTDSKTEFNDEFASTSYAKFDFETVTDIPIRTEVAPLDGVFNEIYNYVYA